MDSHSVKSGCEKTVRRVGTTHFFAYLQGCTDPVLNMILNYRDWCSTKNSTLISHVPNPLQKICADTALAYQIWQAYLMHMYSMHMLNILYIRRCMRTKHRQMNAYCFALSMYCLLELNHNQVFLLIC